MRQTFRLPLFTVLLSLCLSAIALALGLLNRDIIEVFFSASFLSAVNIFFYGLLLEHLISTNKKPVLIFLLLQLKLLSLGCLLYFFYTHSAQNELVAGICGLLCFIPAGFLVGATKN